VASSSGNSNDSKGGMASTPNGVLWAQIQGAQFDQVFTTQPCEFIQQLSQRFAFALSYLSPPIEGLERASLACRIIFARGIQSVRSP